MSTSKKFIIQPFAGCNLKNAGFSNSDISALFPDKSGTRDFAHTKGTKAPEGAATGVGTGAVLGGVLGWLAGTVRSSDSCHAVIEVSGEITALDARRSKVV